MLPLASPALHVAADIKFLLKSFLLVAQSNLLRDI